LPSAYSCAVPIRVRWAGAGSSAAESPKDEIPPVDQCACGVDRVWHPGWPRGAESGVGTFIREHKAALGSGGHTVASRAARVVARSKLHATIWIRTAINPKWHWRRRATGSGGARGRGDCSKGVAKRTGSGNPMTRSAHVDSGRLGRRPSKHRKIGPIIAGSCQMEIHRANSHRRAAARINLNRTRGASEHGD